MLAFYGLLEVPASDSANVTFTDLLPQVALAKSDNPNAISGLGDYVDYTFTISNTGPEAVTVTSLTDPLIALSPSCLALIGQTIGIGGSLQCVSNVYLVIGTGSTFVNTATVIVADNEANTATASATASPISNYTGYTNYLTVNDLGCGIINNKEISNASNLYKNNES